MIPVTILYQAVAFMEATADVGMSANLTDHCTWASFLSLLGCATGWACIQLLKQLPDSMGCSLSHSVVAGCIMLLEAGLCHGQVLVPHWAAQPFLSIERCMEVCGVAGCEWADSLITKGYVAAWGLERVLQGGQCITHHQLTPTTVQSIWELTMRRRQELRHLLGSPAGHRNTEGPSS